jgi:hypothetical protein
MPYKVVPSFEYYLLVVVILILLVNSFTAIKLIHVFKYQLLMTNLLAITFAFIKVADLEFIYLNL